MISEAMDLSSLAELGGDEFFVERHSKSEIVNAGKLIASQPAYDEDAVRAFKIAHDWRSAHIVPMRKIRFDLTLNTKRVQSGGITAARLKRMQSIRKKLVRGPLSLFQVQDIAGCRAIVRSMPELIRLLDIYYEGTYQHEIVRTDDYISDPKRGGYRSHHAVFKFNGRGGYEHLDRQRVEMQIRTKLQHFWATAVEAVGLVRNEDLKAGEGDADWLRFFELMSGEFAVEEAQPVPQTVSENHAERRDEIRELNARLGALKHLQTYNDALRQTENFAVNSTSKYFLIQYDYTKFNVGIRGFSRYPQSYASLIYDEQGGYSEKNTVLVEIDRVSNLRDAYPNYFLDVKAFNERLKAIVETPKIQAFRPLSKGPQGWQPNLVWFSDWRKRKER